MKIKFFILMFFLCAIIPMSTVAVETFKGGAIEESKTKVGIDSWRDWGGSFWGDEEVNNGGGDNGGDERGEKGKKDSSNGKDDWRDWGGSFWGDEEGNGGERQGRGESGRDNEGGYHGGD